MFSPIICENGYKNSKFYVFINVLRIILLAACSWGISLAMIFPMQTKLWVYILLSILSLFEVIKYLISFTHLNSTQKFFEILPIILIICYSAVSITLNESLLFRTLSQILGMLTISQMYLRLSKTYNSIKNYHISTYYRDAVNLFDLFALLIVITHIFVILYLFRVVCCMLPLN